MEELLKQQITLLQRQTALMESIVSQQAAFHTALPILLNVTDKDTLEKYGEIYEKYFKIKFDSISPVSWMTTKTLSNSNLFIFMN